MAALTMLSCSQKKNGYEIDCEQKKKQAQSQFDKKNYTWTIFSRLNFDFDHDIGEKEFIKLLEKRHIQVKYIGLSCVTFPNDQYKNCEETEMNRLLEEKFGKGFTDSLLHLARQNFIKNHSEEIFSYENADSSSRYPNSTIHNQFDKIKEDYFSKYPTPKEYIRSIEDSISSLSARFVITKTGKITDLSIESQFQNKKTIYLKNNSINN